MVASQAFMQQSPETVVQEMAESMETLAAREDWEGVEEIAEKIRRAIVQIPEDERREMLLVARRSTENVQALAIEAHEKVSDKLAGIRRGKSATRAYGAMGR